MDSAAIIEALAKGDKIAELFLKAGVAYTGFKATNHWSGAITGLVALKLSQSPNIFAGASGVGMLTWLGLTAFIPPWKGEIPDIPTPAEMTSGQVGGFGGPTQANYPLPDPDVIYTTVQDCYAKGGQVLRVTHMTNMCDCKLPSDAPPTTVSDPPMQPPDYLLRGGR